MSFCAEEIRQIADGYSLAEKLKKSISNQITREAYHGQHAAFFDIYEIVQLRGGNGVFVAKEIEKWLISLGFHIFKDEAHKCIHIISWGDKTYTTCEKLSQIKLDI